MADSESRRWSPLEKWAAGIFAAMFLSIGGWLSSSVSSLGTQTTITAVVLEKLVDTVEDHTTALAAMQREIIALSKEVEKRGDRVYNGVDDLIKRQKEIEDRVLILEQRN